MTKLAILAALGPDKIIGRDSDIPWDYPEIDEHFASLTDGHSIVFTRNANPTLNGSRNILLSAREECPFIGMDPVIHVEKTVESAIAKGHAKNETVFISGGAKLFEHTLPLADELHLVHIAKKYKGNVRFPAAFNIIPVMSRFEGDGKTNEVACYTFMPPKEYKNKPDAEVIAWFNAHPQIQWGLVERRPGKTEGLTFTKWVRE